MQVVVDNLLTNYTQVGNGSTNVLFLHGWADSSKTFEMLVKDLVKENPSLKATLLDLPGFGSTQQPGKAWGLQDYSQFIHNFLIKIKCDPAIIIGHSNGGAIAIHGLANGSLSSEKLILIGSAGIRNKSAKKSAFKVLSKPAKLALGVASKPAQRRIKEMLYGAIGSDYLIAEHMQDTFKKIVSTDVRTDAKKIEIPTLLIYGENDASTPPEYGQILTDAIKNSKLSIIPEATHFVHQEQVYKVSSLISGFIK